MEPTLPVIRLIAQRAVFAACLTCGVVPHKECRPAGIMHVGRFARAREQGQISTSEYVAVIDYIGEAAHVTEFYAKQVPLG
jgi:hypothetical protein